MKRKLKIAITVTSQLPFPIPKDFSGVYAPLQITLSLAKGLTKKGHEVTFFGPRGSKSKIFKVFTAPFTPLYKNKILTTPGVRQEERIKIFSLFDQYLVSLLFKENFKRKFDIIHISAVDRVLPFAFLVQTPIVYTLHDPIYPWRAKVFKMFASKNQYYVSISNSQRKPAPNLNYAATIYNGINLKNFPFSKKEREYLLFSGRILEKKGVHLAVQAAIKTKQKLVIIGPRYKGNYWREKIEPFLGKNIKYLGCVDRKQLYKYYGNAKALLFPIQWEEPFGLVMIEAMACGTPVIAFNHGSVPEVIKDGKTGFIVNNVSEMAKAIKKIDKIKKEDCRKWVEKKFSLEKMVNEYEKVYYKILKKSNL